MKIKMVLQLRNNTGVVSLTEEKPPVIEIELDGDSVELAEYYDKALQIGAFYDGSIKEN